VAASARRLHSGVCRGNFLRNHRAPCGFTGINKGVTS